MSILFQIPNKELGTRLTHYGWFCGVVPVFLGDLEGEAPLVVERNGISEWVLSLAGALFRVFVKVAAVVAPDRDIQIPLVVTGPITPLPGGDR
ncbi:hypothetical protein ABW38_22005 [Achromobacter xylosoxidans]|uniref:hypothetical protein n=1 Tax=Achromobacter TaxID=222 RepID=UPI0006AC09A5|nr:MULTISPECIES: hypothetical protein [Achromobacter]KOQ29467.1 hypothetical protein ABW34_05540 [Achromobacter xylosoxidans]KOQ29744.1 hypothetical protein ABW35_03535 [Achromobacter xylosoxidans]KOQ34569.1 hypothetical protein ABW36_05395 [Achromobacter xylosoxidans]KOQ41090.1 hypothetical protein ABW38_22005 [Achromobacter xylosoxidans]KOQ45534.1 hypothetical protein ABW37_05750 [Achromobacter xylosoxidans]